MLKPAIGAALALVSACAAQTPVDVYTMSPPALAPVEAAETARAERREPARSTAACDIRVTRTSRGVKLDAIAHADGAVRGDYDFVITARGSGGSSDITQGGPFDLEAGERATVGSAEIPGGRYRAVLTLRDADDELCRLEQKS